MTDSPAAMELVDDLQTSAHVWWCDPLRIQDRAKLSAYRSVLSAQEIERYRRFYFDKDRHSYLVSHALLRHSLSKYVDIDASQWQFCSDRHGKPELVSQPLKQAINFNLTHTDGLSACIITLDKPCGIDAEHKNSRHRLDAVAKRMFAVQEQRQLDMKNIAQRFFYYWTLREAYVKALGSGLAGSSKAFYFDVDIKKMSAAIRHRDDRLQPAENWFFRLYEPTPAHVLSVAIESPAAIQVRVAELVP